MISAQPSSAAPDRRTSGPTGWRGALARPERVFVALAVVFGALGIVVVPPFRHPDEPAHFRRVYQVSEGRVLARHEGDRIGEYLPRSLDATISYFTPFFKPADPRLQAPGAWRALWRQPLAPDEREFVDLRFAAQYYTPVVYLPQALAVAVGRWVGASPLLLLYFGRAGGLAAWILCGYAALKFLPVLRWVLLLVMLAPISFLHSQVVSADTLANAVSFVLVAALVRAALGSGPLPGRQVLLLAGLGVLLALCKTAYTPLTLLVLAVPPRRCGSGRRYAALAGLVVGLSVAAALGWWWLGSAGQPTALPGWAGASFPRQVAFVRQHPGQFLWTNVRTLNWTYLAQSVGFADLPVVPGGDEAVALYVAVIALLALWGGQADVALPRRARGLLVATALAVALSINVTVYLVLAAVGAVEIPVQGRYLVPLHLPLALAL